MFRVHEYDSENMAGLLSTSNNGYKSIGITMMDANVCVQLTLGKKKTKVTHKSSEMVKPILFHSVCIQCGKESSVMSTITMVTFAHIVI